MSTIKFSDSANAPSATSITVPFGGSPAVGDLIVVFLLVDNEIITHQPGWASEFTANPDPWFPLDSFRAPNSATLSGWYHTWNASDSGNSAVFTFVPAPTLGIGDKDVPNTNAVAVAVVFDGTHSTAVLEHSIYGTAQNLVGGINVVALKLAALMEIYAVAGTSTTSGMQNSDALAVNIGGGAIPTTNGGISLTVYSRANPPLGYSPNVSLLNSFLLPPTSMISAAVSVSDNPPQIYNPPYIEEGPMGENVLMYRYRINRFFTVLNNGGTFSAQRYQSTDQIAAATQVFVNNQPITSTDRSNILASGVGGDFRAVS